MSDNEDDFGPNAGSEAEEDDFDLGSETEDEDGSIGVPSEDEDAPKAKSKAKTTTKAAAKPKAKEPKQTKAAAAKSAAKATPAAAPKGKAAAGSGAAGAGAASSSAASSAAAASSSTAAAPPIAGFSLDKLKPVTNEREAEDLIGRYMRAANRPYSAINVYDNLHGAVPKASVPRILDKLCEGETPVLRSKEYGKFKIYWPDQSAFGAISQSDIDAVNREGTELGNTAAQTTIRRKDLTAQVAALSTAMTDEDLEIALAEARNTTAELRRKLETLQGSTVLVKPEERAAAVATFERYRKGWVDRKRMVTDVINSMSEGLEKKPSVIANDVGVESDESVKLDVRNFTVAAVMARATTVSSSSRGKAAASSSSAAGAGSAGAARPPGSTPPSAAACATSPATTTATAAAAAVTAPGDGGGSGAGVAAADSPVPRSTTAASGTPASNTAPAADPVSSSASTATAPLASTASTVVNAQAVAPSPAKPCVGSPGVRLNGSQPTGSSATPRQGTKHARDSV